VFALLGMRALYFLLAGAAVRLRYQRPGLAVILGGVAVKLLLADVWEFPAWSAPAFITAVLAVAATASLRDTRRPRLAGRAGEVPEAPPPRDQAHAEARRGGASPPAGTSPPAGPPTARAARR
jgi:hypothetical protein